MVKKQRDGFQVCQKKINKAMKKKLKVRGLKVPPSIILSHFCNDNRIKNYYDVSFSLWESKNAQDKELDEFDFDLCIIPTNLSYELYKSGYPLKLLCVNIWGILHIMSKRNILFSWSNLQKKSIAIPMKGNMPDTIFKVLAKKNNCDLEKIAIIYCESYQEACQFLIKGKVDFAVLPEPYASDIELKGFNRVLNLQDNWGRSFYTKTRYPQACTVIHEKFNMEEYRNFYNVLQSSSKKIYEDPEDSSKVGQSLLGIDSKIINNSFKYCNLETISGSDSLEEIQLFFEILNSFSNNINNEFILDSNFIAL